MPNLFVTALPNGFVDPSATVGHARLSLFLTPSVPNGALLIDPFTLWPLYVRSLRWDVTFRDATGVHRSMDVGGSPLSADSEKMWKALFAQVKPAKARDGYTDIRDKNMRSSDSIPLAIRHREHRAYKALSKMSPVRSTLRTRMLEAALKSGPAAVFTHPQIFAPTVPAGGSSAFRVPNSPNDPGTYADAADMAGAIRTLIDGFAASGDPWRVELAARYRYASTALTREREGLLSHAAQLQLLTQCAESLPAVIPLAPGLAVVDAFVKAPVPGIAPRTGGSDYAAALPMYLNHLLFHAPADNAPDMLRMAGTSEDLPKPDFHQILGLLTNYPALLRPLGLVVDLELDLPPGLTAGTVSAVPTVASRPPLLDPAGYLTAYTVVLAGSPRQFYTSPRSPDSSMSQGMLKLRDEALKHLVPRFRVVTEDGEADTQKYLQQLEDRDRAREYTGSGSTALLQSPPTTFADTEFVTPPRPVAHSDELPSQRTVGIALQYRDRIANLQDTWANGQDAAAANGTATFHAEDVTLGYRLDVHYSRTWYKLCARKSSYEIVDLTNNASTVATWAPAHTDEDEGFISPGATEVVTDAKMKQTEIRLHETLCTWTGYSLAVRPPKGFEFEDEDPTPTPAPQQRLGVNPTYGLNGLLPPLHFGGDYTLRCRTVDLAGNSVDVDKDLPKYSLGEAPWELTVDPRFSRHEPIRAPHTLLLTPLDRTATPGEQDDRMVLRPGKRNSLRVLAPPRETLRLAELHGLAGRYRHGDSAFADKELTVTGDFPEVPQPPTPHGTSEIRKADHADAHFRPRVTHRDDQIPYLPDPWALFARLEPFLLSENPAWAMPDPNPHWLPFAQSMANWPHYRETYVKLVPGSSVSYRTDGNTLIVTLPEASTVLLKMSSARLAGDTQSNGIKSEQANGASQLWLYNAVTALANQFGLVRPAGLTQADFAALTNIKTLAGTKLFDGSISDVSPFHVVTLVHAVKRPLATPQFTSLPFVRKQGSRDVMVHGSVLAHWKSTAQVSVMANWRDTVDDPYQPKLSYRDVNHPAFVMDAPRDAGEPPSVIANPVFSRDIPDDTLHHLPDTNAHCITYKPTAVTRFREYFPLEDPESDFTTGPGEEVTVQVPSTVRPLPPAISYVIPAFRETSTYDPEKRQWRSGKVIVLRVYLERPFLLTGNAECVALLFARNGPDAPAEMPVTRWGSDPTLDLAGRPITQQAMTGANFPHVDVKAADCVLPDGKIVTALPYPIEFVPERGLWYTDIHVETLGVHSPFVRLALARWQPHALSSEIEAAAETRVSAPVFADFLQVAPGRWISITRKRNEHDRGYDVSVSGTFGKETECPIEVELEGRWYAMDRDLGWRKVTLNPQPTPRYIMPVTTADLPAWKVSITLPHSSLFHNYRLLVREFQDLTDNTPADPGPLPVAPHSARRVVYSHYVDLP